MEVQQTTQKAGRKTATTKKETTAASAATNVAATAPVVENNEKTEKKPRSKKSATTETAAAVEVETTTSNDETIEAAPENSNETMSDAQEVLAHMSVLSEQMAQLSTKFKSVKDFDSEFSKQFKKTFGIIERSVNVIDGHFSDVLVKIQTAAEKKAGTKAKRAKTTSPADPNKVHPLKAPKTAHDFVVAALKKPAGTQVSRHEVHSYISDLVKAHKDDDYKVTVNGEVQKKFFYINKGELGAFFKNIQSEFTKQGATEKDIAMGYVDANNKLPEYTSYNKLMGYVSKCFPTQSE